jgi:hypothetical protein
MSEFTLRRMGLLMEPEPGNPLEGVNQGKTEESITRRRSLRIGQRKDG